MLTKGFGVRGSQLQHQQGDEAGWKREEDERRRAGKQPCTSLPVRRTTAHYSPERLRLSRAAPLVHFCLRTGTLDPGSVVITKSN